MNYTMHTEPWKHQVEGLEYFMTHTHGALYTDMGSGKSKILVDTFVNRKFRDIIIVAPPNVCPSWVLQIKTHAPKKFRIVDLTKINGTVNKRDYLKAYHKKYQGSKIVVIINYESVWRKPLKEYLLKYKFDAVVCDESHRIKSASSKCSGMLTLLGRRIKYRYLVTGTPIASPLDIYAQYRFLDPSIFGTNFSAFKNYYANYVTYAGGFPVLDKKNPYKNLDELRAKMFSIAFYVENIDNNLPDTVDIEVPFYMSSKAEKAYHQLLEDGAIEFKSGFVTTKNILGVMLKLQQLTSGYLTLEDDDGKMSLIQGDKSRLDCLAELLGDIPSSEPIVIFCRYTQDIRNVQRVLDELKIKHSELSGKNNTMSDWDKDKTRVLVIQIQAGAEGLNNLVKSHYCIYYSLHPSLQLWKQSRKRQHRHGQKHVVKYYTLVAQMSKGKSIDRKILDALAANEDLVQRIMNGDESLA